MTSRGGCFETIIVVDGVVIYAEEAIRLIQYGRQERRRLEAGYKEKQAECDRLRHNLRLMTIAMAAFVLIPLLLILTRGLR